MQRSWIYKSPWSWSCDGVAYDRSEQEAPCGLRCVLLSSNQWPHGNRTALQIGRARSGLFLSIVELPGMEGRMISSRSTEPEYMYMYIFRCSGCSLLFRFLICCLPFWLSERVLLLRMPRLNHTNSECCAFMDHSASLYPILCPLPGLLRLFGLHSVTHFHLIPGSRLTTASEARRGG